MKTKKAHLFDAALLGDVLVILLNLADFIASAAPTYAMD
jgi:hypothetical protein